MIARLAIATAALALLASPTFAGGGAKKKDESWGKAGVSFAAYSADALECSNRAYGVEVRMKPYGPVGVVTGMGAAVVPAGVWTKLAPGEVMIYTTTFVEGYNHAAKMDVVEQLQSEVDSCLVGKGYSKFRLTPSQMRKLRSMEIGSPERAAYLHSLGSNRNVLDSQSLDSRA